MAVVSSKEFRSDLISVGERIRDICAARVPASLGKYTGSQLRMINRIYRLTRQSEEGIQLKQLASVLDITPAATSEMVETLVRRGALERKVSASDRRAVALRVSPELEELFQNSINYLDDRLQHFFAEISPEEAAAAVVIMHKLNLFLSEAVEEKEMEK